MKHYKIVWTGRQIGDPEEFSDPTGLGAWVVDSESTYKDALFLARLYAAEHADRLDTAAIYIEHGAEFYTNNGTLVRYEVVGIPLNR